MAVFDFLGLLASPVTEWLKGRAERQKVKEEGKVRIAEAEIAAAVARVERSEDYDANAVSEQKYSWKDEYIVVVLFAPFIGSFIPEVQVHVAAGWTYLAKAPAWYPYALLGVIAGVFGLRWYFNKK